MNDDLRDLLDPGDDPRVAAVLHRIQADLLVAPDELVAARHRRTRRAAVSPAPALRRTAVAVFLAVAGTGAALSTFAPAPTVPGSPVGEELEGSDDVPTHRSDGRVSFLAPTGRPGLELPSFTDQLPAAPAVGPVRPAAPVVPEDRGDHAPGLDRAPAQPRVGPPDDVPGADAPPSEPGPPAATPTGPPPSGPPATPAGPGATPGADAVESHSSGGDSGQDTPGDASHAGDDRADTAREDGPPPPEPTGRR